MAETVLEVRDVSKLYRLGEVGTGTLVHDLNRWWSRLRGGDDPESIVGQINRRDQAPSGEYVWALQNVNFEVQQGEILGILGSNGAGKSTLLKIISRITSPTTGRIRAKGRIASLLEVGTGMHPDMTARQNVYLNGAILGMRRREIAAKFDQIIDFAGCQMYVDTPVKRFSSGMRVRLGFAVAAFLESEIMIVDEVLAVGDAEFQRKCIGQMQEVSTSGRTILFVSHNLATLRRLCTRGIVMNAGSISFSGATQDCIDHYSQLFEKDAARMIRDQITELQQGLEITSIEVNQSTRHLQILPAGARSISVRIEGTVHSPVQGAVDVRFCDSAGGIFASFSGATHSRQGMFTLDGRFCIESTIDIPPMNYGDFVLDLDLTGPRSQSWMKCPAAVRFHSEGLALSSPVAAPGKDERGWFSLTGTQALGSFRERPAE